MTDAAYILDVSSAQAPGRAPGRASLQDDLDWAWAASQGVIGALVECSIGNDGVNLDLAGQLADASSAGLLVGIYNFVYPLPADGAHANRSADDQARLHWSQAPKLTGRRLRTFFDAEWPYPQDWKRWGCSSWQIDDWLDLYAETYEGLSGDTLGLYSYPDWMHAAGLNGTRPLWLASVPQPANGAILWQQTGHEWMIPTRSGRSAVRTDVSLVLSGGMDAIVVGP